MLSNFLLFLGQMPERSRSGASDRRLRPPPSLVRSSEAAGSARVGAPMLNRLTVSALLKVEILPSLDFPEHQTLVGELGRLNKTLLVEQAEFWTDAVKPKASRRLALAQEYVDTEDGLLTTLDKLSSTLAASVNHQDATIDQ